jgi:hypothetical protein
MLDEEAINAVGFLEFLMGSLLDNPTLGYDRNDVSIFDCAQTMSNDQDGSIFAYLIQSVL